MIYEFLTSKGRLEAHHKKELLKKRGFTEETIKEYKFFSGGKYILDFEQDLIKTFNESDLIKSGIFIKIEGTDKISISEQLLGDRIIVPYLDKNNKAYFVRPHKLGLSIPIEVYHSKSINLLNRNGAILTEGEFKAVAGCQLGICSIAMPGIGSFSDKQFPKLIEFLNNSKIKELCIIFDNEIKDNPQFPNYKEEPMKRYDTEYFAYVMAKRLINEGIDTRIGTLPDSWRVNGKVDIDGALAQGKTKEDILYIIRNSKIPKVYIDGLSKEIVSIIQKKLAKKFHKSHIHKDFNKYVATRYKGKTEWQEIISNFTIRIIATHDTVEGMVREAVFIDEFGNSSKSFALEPGNMARIDAFKEFCLRKGNFIWTGNADDLFQIWTGEFLDDDGRIIVEPDHIGWLQSDKTWVFGNIAIKFDGTEIRPDKSNTFWTDKKGIKPIPISVTTGRTSISEGIPYLNLSSIDIFEIKDKLQTSIGEFEADIALGWITSLMFMEEVFGLYNCFPFLFVTGRRGSGKSTIAEWLMHFFGIDNAGKMAADTTAVALQRYLAYYSCLPVFIDEYRNTKQIAMKNGFLRNAYNRQSAGKGIKSSFGIREGKIRGSLILVGEETPEDNALLTRCIVINVSEKHRKENHFNWFQLNKRKFSYHILSVLKNKPKNVNKFLEILQSSKDYFVGQGRDDRTAMNYAIVAAGFETAFKENNKRFAEFLSRETDRVKQEYQKEQAVGVFLEDILVMQSLGKFPKPLWGSDHNNIYLYFQGIYMIWAQEYRKTKGIEPFKASAIRDYLKEEPGYIDMNKPKRIGRDLRKCIIFDREKAPEEVRALVDEGSMEGLEEKDEGLYE